MGWLELIGTPSVNILHRFDCTWLCCLLCQSLQLWIKASWKDWDHSRGDLDGNGPGTVIGNKHSGVKSCKDLIEGWLKVKWDNTGEHHNHRMGAEGKYDLVIIDLVKPIPSLASKLFKQRVY